MKILHVSYHDGCIKTLNYVAQSLGLKIETQKADWNYNIGYRRAEEIWNKYKDYYNGFDIIITTDTGPLCRIFLQNDYAGKLIINCSNRIDYHDSATLDCDFPDKGYYRLLREIKAQQNVKFFSYTKFEYEYALKYRNVDLGTDIIKPSAFIEEGVGISAFSSEINKEDIFFIPPYHNDTIFMNLKEKCLSLGINAYAGRYNGPSDLKGVKGIIHIPYGWCNLALFENWSLGNVYFIPSKEFFLQLSKQKNFWWQDSYALELLDSSEWYLPEHRELFIYFDNWEQLKLLTENQELITNKKELIEKFSKKHSELTLSQWDKAFNEW